MKHYEGIRTESGVVVRVATDDCPNKRDLPARMDVINHSLDGFEWGYAGSGPTQLALALAIDALDGDVVRAVKVYQDVKWQITAKLDGNRWLLTQESILETIHAIETARARLRAGASLATAGMR